MEGDDDHEEWWTVMDCNPLLILIVSVQTPNNSFEIHSTHTSEYGIIALLFA
jgi:hypothetical protein